MPVKILNTFIDNAFSSLALWQRKWDMFQKKFKFWVSSGVKQDYYYITNFLFFIKFWRSILQKVKGHPHDISINSFRSSSSTATPMLSFVMTLFSIASDPSEFAIASWLNSTVCFWTKVNLKQKQKQTQT